MGSGLAGHWLFLLPGDGGGPHGLAIFEQHLSCFLADDELSLALKLVSLESGDAATKG